MDIKSVNNTAPTQPAYVSNGTKVADKVDSLPKESNLKVNNSQGSMGFVLNENLSNHMITVIKDKKTGKTLKTIPTEEQLKIKQQLAESIGRIHDLIA